MCIICKIKDYYGPPKYLSTKFAFNYTYFSAYFHNFNMISVIEDNNS